MRDETGEHSASFHEGNQPRLRASEGPARSHTSHTDLHTMSRFTVHDANGKQARLRRIVRHRRTRRHIRRRPVRIRFFQPVRHIEPRDGKSCISRRHVPIAARPMAIRTRGESAEYESTLPTHPTLKDRLIGTRLGPRIKAMRKFLQLLGLVCTLRRRPSRDGPRGVRPPPSAQRRPHGGGTRKRRRLHPFVTPPPRQRSSPRSIEGSRFMRTLYVANSRTIGAPQDRVQVVVQGRG